jgi:hypothetical protein
VGSSGRAGLGVGLDRSDTETMGSNPAYGMGVFSSSFTCHLIISVYSPVAEKAS